MNKITNHIYKTRDEKLAAENTVLNDCMPDMSDVSFEVTENYSSIKLFGFVILFALFWCGRIGFRRLVGNPNYKMTTIDKAFVVFIICLIIFMVVYAVVKRFSKPITIAGKNIFYNGNCWTSDDISEVECTALSYQIKVYSNGKKVFEFSWERDNSEMFIAWVRKCEISFTDKRKKL